MAGDGRRVVALFGHPGAGTSTIARCLADAVGPRVVVLSPDFGDLEEQVRKAKAEVIFIDGFPPCGRDATGYVAGPDAVQYLFDRRIIFPGSGGIVRVAYDPELLVHQRRASPGGLKTWFAGLPLVEERIRMLDMPYFLIHNEPGPDGMMVACSDLARRASIVE